MAIIWGTGKDHHGYLDIVTKLGKRTAFTLYLPVTEEQVQTTPRPTALEHYTGKGERVLVINESITQR
jgi:hypothetical protein